MMLKRITRYGSVLVTLLLSAVVIMAQVPEECFALLNQNQLTEKADACGDLAAGEACVVEGFVQMGLGALPTGTRLDLRTTNRLDVGSMAVENYNWGYLKANLGMSESGVEAIVYGSAQLDNQVQAIAADAPTFPVRNVAGYPINIREGAGSNYSVVGTMGEGDSFTATGRNADSQWVRMQTPDGIAWVFNNLVNVDGDIAALPVVDSPYTNPLQAMTLQTVDSPACATDSSGMIVRHESDSRVRMQINGVDVQFGNATFIARAQANEQLEFFVLDGSINVTASTLTQRVEVRDSATVALADLVPADIPRVQSGYRFASLSGAPLELLPEEDAVCFVGYVGDGEAPMSFGGPGDPYAAVSNISGDAVYVAEGYALDDSSAAWWKLDNNRWVQQEQVQTSGLCQQLAEVEPPPIRNNTASASGGSLLPNGTSIWQAASGPDILSGTCNTPALAVCNHPVAIQMQPDGSITWRGQEPISYPMTKVGENRYIFNGRNFIGDANIALDLTITSDSTFSLTFQTVYDRDPLCTHTFNYTATRTR